MTGFHEDDAPQLPPCWDCGRDTWRPGERWYFVRGPRHVEPYCQDCLPPEHRDTTVFVQNGPEPPPAETDPAAKERQL